MWGGTQRETTHEAPASNMRSLQRREEELQRKGKGSKAKMFHLQNIMGAARPIKLYIFSTI